MSANHTSNGREHSRELPVGLDVGIVDVHLVASTQVLDVVIVNHGVCCWGHGNSRGCCHGGNLLLTRVQPSQHCTNAKASSQDAEDALRLARLLQVQLLKLHLRCGQLYALWRGCTRSGGHVGGGRDGQKRSGKQDTGHGYLLLTAAKQRLALDQKVWGSYELVPCASSCEWHSLASIQELGAPLRSYRPLSTLFRSVTVLWPNWMSTI